MTSPLTFGVLDIGTHKIAAVVVELRPGFPPRLLGYGVAPSRGMEQGAVVNLPELSRVVARVMGRALRMAQAKGKSLPIWSNVATAPVKAFNHRGVVGVTQGVVDEQDIQRAEEAAQAVPVEHNQMVLHVLRRGYRLDERPVRYPLGMFGYRLEAEVHIITVPRTDIYNLQQAIEEAGLTVEGFVLNALASGEAVLSDAEREMGVVMCDIGAGTTDVAVYADGEVCHVGVVPIGGRHLTQDLSYVLSIPLSEAERLKVRQGYAHPDVVPEDAEWITIRPFGEGEAVQIHARDVAAILEARLRQLLDRVREVVVASGKEGKLPAGLVLTGGTAHLPGLRHLAMDYLKVPVRIAKPSVPSRWPRPMTGPDFATLVGLMRFARLIYEQRDATPVSVGEAATWWGRIKRFLVSLLPALAALGAAGGTLFGGPG